MEDNFYTIPPNSQHYIFKITTSQRMVLNHYLPRYYSFQIWPEVQGIIHKNQLSFSRKSKPKKQIKPKNTQRSNKSVTKELVANSVNNAVKLKQQLVPIYDVRRLDQFLSDMIIYVKKNIQICIALRSQNENLLLNSLTYLIVNLRTQTNLCKETLIDQFNDMIERFCEEEQSIICVKLKQFQILFQKIMAELQQVPRKKSSVFGSFCSRLLIKSTQDKKDQSQKLWHEMKTNKRDCIFKQ